jgi:dCMP deaminase
MLLKTGKEKWKMEPSRRKQFNITFANIAKQVALLSRCKRAKVGAIIVKDRNIISFGYNGTPCGFCNTCEDENGETKNEVIHAEANAILKCAKWGNSCNESTLYITLSPCKDCAKLILQAGITRVVYLDDYKDSSGLDFLRESGIEIKKYPN